MSKPGQIKCSYSKLPNLMLIPVQTNQYFIMHQHYSNWWIVKSCSVEAAVFWNFHICKWILVSAAKEKTTQRKWRIWLMHGYLNILQSRVDCDFCVLRDCLLRIKCMNFLNYVFMCLGLHGFACSKQHNSLGNVHPRRPNVDVQSPEVSWDLWSGRIAR